MRFVRTALIIMTIMGSTKVSKLHANEYSIIYTEQKNRIENLVALNDGKRTQVTHSRRKDSSPVMSPDGKQIVFTSERVGWWKIWMLDLASQNYTQFTHSSAAEYSPSWSPDGKQIVFVSSRDGNSEIYTMNADGSGQRNLTKRRGSDISPFWASDNRIYFSSETAGTFQIASMDPQGNDRQVIGHGSANKLMPQVSPDRQYILYYSDKNDNVDVYKMRLDGSNEQRLTHSPLLDMRAKWSVDGLKIVFERGNKKDSQHIFIMSADGNEERQLTFDGYNYAPAFVTSCKNLCDH